jgi:glycosyltransferase involved in cell wall biosynthesis
MLVENNSYPKDPRVRKEAETLASAGYQVSVISPADRNQKWREAINGVDVYRYPAPASANSSAGYVYEYTYSMIAIFILSLWVYVRVGFDIVHAANPPDTLALIAAVYKCFGRRFVFDHHDPAPELYRARFLGSVNPLVYWGLVQFEKCACRLADQVIAVNQSCKAIVLSRDRVPESRIVIVRNGPILGQHDTLRSYLAGNQQKQLVIAYAGIIGVQDGVDILIRIVYRLVFELHRENFVCLIIGDGQALQELKQTVKELGVAQYVHFTGWVSDPVAYARYLATADICVDPSPSNAYNDCCTATKIMEYMAAGKPVVAFDLREHRVTAGPSALYATPNNESAFAAAVVQLMTDDSLRRAMGRAGKQRVESELAWTLEIPVLLAVYDRLSLRSTQTIVSPESKTPHEISSTQ